MESEKMISLNSSFLDEPLIEFKNIIDICGEAVQWVIDCIRGQTENMYDVGYGCGCISNMMATFGKADIIFKWCCTNDIDMPDQLIKTFISLKDDIKDIEKQHETRWRSIALSQIKNDVLYKAYNQYETREILLDPSDFQFSLDMHDFFEFCLIGGGLKQINKSELHNYRELEKSLKEYIQNTVINYLSKRFKKKVLEELNVPKAPEYFWWRHLCYK